MRTVDEGLAGGSHWNEAYARVLLAEFQESGVSLAEFARRHGIRPGRVAYWQSRLGEAPAAPQFLPVSLPAELGGAPHHGAVDVTISNGWVVRANPGVDSESLRSVLSTLMELERGAPC